VRIEERLTLEADRERVWMFVADVGQVLALLPGVTEITRVDGESWQLRIRQKVGFIEADFDLRVVVVLKDAPRLLRFRSEGKGIQVPALVVTNDELRLHADAEGRRTEVEYVSEVQLSGKLAALGHAVMKFKAREVVGEFRRRFGRRFEEFQAAAEPGRA
jgi:carbon monoxide dehydrogenase subunit G